MRYLVLFLVVAAALGCLWGFSGGGRPRTADAHAALLPSQADTAELQPRTPRAEVQLASVNETASTTTSQTAAAGPESLAGAEPVEPADTNRRLVGTVTDRFGAAQVGEYIYALRAGQLHPLTLVEAEPLPQARSEDDGRFNLVLPDAGPWSFAIGVPGRARMPASAPRSLGTQPEIEVVVPGASAITLAFDSWPSAGEGALLEVEMLVERPSAQPGASNDPIATEQERRARKSKKRSRRDQPGGLNRGSTDLDSAPGAREGRREKRGRGDGRGRGAGGANSDAEAKGEDAPSSKRGKEKARGGRRGSPRTQDDLQALGYAAPEAPDQWRVAHRRELSVDGAGAPLELTSLPAGETHRLTLQLGSRRLEGVERFVLQPDTLVEVRVFPVSAGSTALTYTTATRALSAELTPAGVRWRE